MTANVILKMNDSVVSGNKGYEGDGIYSAADRLVLNNCREQQRDYQAGGGGIFGGSGMTILNGTTSVRGNTAEIRGGGMEVRGPGGTGNTALVLNDSTSAAGNRALRDGDGIYNCRETLTGAVDGDNVKDNYLGSSGTTEDNIVSLLSC